MQKKILLVLSVCILGMPSINYGIDNAHFYRAAFFWGEPRFEKPWLTSIDTTVGGGSTMEGYNNCGNKTSLLAIYGLENLVAIGVNVPNLDDSPEDTILKGLNALSPVGPFGKVRFGGKFNIVENTWSIQQNFINGFFVQLYVPIRHLEIDTIVLADETPLSGVFGATQQWQNFLNNLQNILSYHGLNTNPINESGFGDLSIMAGYTFNHQDTSFLDYIDVTIKAGVLFPTGKGRNTNSVFSIPLGYNKHWGLPVTFDAAIGVWEWLTVGWNSGILLFFDRTETLRMKTAFEQNGFIKLTQGKARLDALPLWHIGIYGKIDHIRNVASLTFAYSFNKKERTYIYPQDSNFNGYIVNSDTQFHGWNMGVFNFLFELDLSREQSKYYPRIGFYFNQPVSGKRTFNTEIGGLTLGLDLSWTH